MAKRTYTQEQRDEALKLYEQTDQAKPPKPPGSRKAHSQAGPKQPVSELVGTKTRTHV